MPQDPHVPPTTTIQPLLHVDFLGGEFDREHGGLGLSAAAALVYLQKAVHSVARRLYFLDNPTRRRVGESFDSGFELVLSSFQQGGSRLGEVARRARTDVSERPARAGDYHDKAMRLIICCLAAATDGAALEDQPEAVVQSEAFHNIVRLHEVICRPGEALRILPAGTAERTAQPANLSEKTRARLGKWQEQQKSQRWSRRLILAGVV